MNSFKSSHIYYGLAILITLVALTYGLTQYKVMRAQAAAVIDNQSVVVSIGERKNKLQKYYDTFAVTQVEVQKSLLQTLNEVIPIGEQYTDLTRQFDSFFAQHDSATNPIFQSSLRFGKGTKVDKMPNIGALPITMNIEGTRENFFAFLQFINQSGTQTSRTRLISINSIQLNFPDGGEVLENKRQVINFTVDMTAYYRLK